MKRKKIFLSVFLICLTCVILYWAVSGISAQNKVKDCEAMTPVSAHKDASYIDLDFSEKERLSMTKYGFRKKIVLEEPSVIVQNAGGPPTSFAYFGVFRDDALRDPVEVVDFKWLYRDDDFEEGKVDEVPYDPEKDGIVSLEAGTYFAAVYTSNPFSSLEAGYKCQICPLNKDGKLQAGKKAYFYGLSEGQKNIFEIVPEKTGTVSVVSNIFNQGTMKLYDEAGNLLQETHADRNAAEGLDLKFAAEKDVRYLVEITELPIEKESFGMYLTWVKYTESR